jgi:hypothetical protein
MPWPARRIGEHARAVAFGGVFVGYQDTTFVKVLRRTRVLRYAPRLMQSFARGNKTKYMTFVEGAAVSDSRRTLNDMQGSFESYRHYVAKKA